MPRARPTGATTSRTSATVNGQGINKDAFRERFAVELFRLDYLERQIHADQAAGASPTRRRRPSSACSTSAVRASVRTRSRRYRREADRATRHDRGHHRHRGPGHRAAARRGNDGRAPARLDREYDPEVADGATEPTEEQKAAAKAEAEAALAEIRGGKSFEDVAKEKSDDVSKNVGGDLGP